MSCAEKFMRHKTLARKSLRSAAICKVYMFGSKLRFSAFTHSSMHTMQWNRNEEKYEKKVELHFIISKTNVFRFCEESRLIFTPSNIRFLASIALCEMRAKNCTILIFPVQTWNFSYFFLSFSALIIIVASCFIICIHYASKAMRFHLSFTLFRKVAGKTSAIMVSYLFSWCCVNYFFAKWNFLLSQFLMDGN